MDKRFIFMKIMSTGGCLHLPRGYIHVYDNNIKYVLSSRLANQSQTVCGASLRRGNENFMLLYKCQGHMINIAVMAINSKNL